MTDANLSLVLNRFMELFEENLRSAIRMWSGKAAVTENRVMAVFVQSQKQVMRELCLTGCPYGKIWECKKGDGA